MDEEALAADAAGGDEELGEADALEDGELGEAAPDDEACAALFGVDRLRERNRIRREANAVDVEDLGDELWIQTREAGWDEPKHLVVEGLELVETSRERDGEWLAVVAIDEALAEDVGCEAGEYEIAMDDSLGARGRILSVVHDLVLVEITGQLAYLSTFERDVPLFRVIWESSWKIYLQPDDSKQKRRRKRRTRRTRRRRRR